MSDDYTERQGVKGGEDAGDVDRNTEQAPPENRAGTGGTNTPPGGVTGNQGRSVGDVESGVSPSNAAERQISDAARRSD